MFKFKKNNFKQPVPLTKLIPNFLTIFGLLLGVSSIKFALTGQWEVAAYCTLIAALIDGVDGRVARLLNATSPFGAELDSLCDFANFGVAPMINVYLWSFGQSNHTLLAWAVMLLFIVCMAIRLARFNTSIFTREYNSKLQKMFFTGIPAPCGALLAIMPIILDFEVAPIVNLRMHDYIILINFYIVIIALLLASRLPTFSFKNLNIAPEYLALTMILSGSIIILLLIYPWYFLPTLSVLYLILIPLASKSFKKHRLQIENA